MWPVPTALTSAYQGHLANYEAALHGERLSPHTKRNYLTQIKQFLLFAQGQGLDSELLLKDANVRDLAIELYKIELELTHSNGSINTLLATLRNFYRLNGSTPFALQQAPRPRPVRKVLEADQLLRVLNVLKGPMNNRDRAIVTLFLFAGLRLSECVELNVDDVIPASTDIAINVSGRTITLSSQAANLFNPWWEERNSKWFHASAALFLNKHGSRITASGLDSIVRKTGLQAMVVLSASILRNTSKNF